MNLLKQIRSVIAPLANEIIKQAPMALYCLVLGVYYLCVLSENVRFNLSLISSGLIVRILSACALVLLGIFISRVFAGLIQRVWVLVLALALELGFLYLCAGMQRDLFDGLMIVLLAVGAYGKNYEKLLKVLLGCTVGVVLLALIGIPIGLTLEASKVGKYGTGLAFGLAHPNVFGSYIVFIFVTIWYLYIKKKPRPVEYGYFVLS